jgi:hypothetical protein
MTIFCRWREEKYAESAVYFDGFEEREDFEAWANRMLKKNPTFVILTVIEGKKVHIEKVEVVTKIKIV